MGSAAVDGGSEMTISYDPREDTMSYKEYLKLLDQEAEDALFTSGGRGEPEGSGNIGGVIRQKGRRTIVDTAYGRPMLATEWNAVTDKATWALKDGVLTISGNGPMAWFSESRKDGIGGFPFYGNPYVKTIVVDEGVTEADFTGCRLPNLKTVIVMDASSNVGLDSTKQTSMETVVLGANMKQSPYTHNASVTEQEKTIYLTNTIRSGPSKGYVSADCVYEFSGTGLYRDVLPWNDLVKMARNKLQDQPESVLAMLPDELMGGETGEVQDRCVVILNPNLGTGILDELLLVRGEVYGDLPRPTGSEGFMGWFTTPKYGGTRVDSDSIVPDTNRVELYARWTGTGISAEVLQADAVAAMKSDPAYQARLEANRKFLASDIEEKYYINTIVEPEVKALSDSLCASASTAREKLDAIHAWVTDNVYYYGPAGKTWDTAKEVMDSGLAVCSDYTILFQALCMAQDIPCIYVKGTTSNADSRGHAWNAVKLNDQWEWVDATWGTYNTAHDDGSGGVIKTPGGRTKAYYLCSTEFISTDHEAYNPFIKKGINVPNDDAKNKPVPEPPKKTTEDAQKGTPEDILKKAPVELSEAEVEQTVKALWQSDASAWAIQELELAARLGLVPDDLTDNMRDPITRKDFCRLAMNYLTRMSGSTGEELVAQYGKREASDFQDCDHADVTAAYALGIVNGRGGSIFAPDDSITRQEAAAMLCRTARVLKPSAAGIHTQSFSDLKQLPNWARDGVAFCVSLTTPDGKAVMGGVGDRRFDPTGTYTREQAILTVSRLFQALM